MTNQEILQKLRRLHTLLVLGKRSNNLDLAIRRAIDTVSSWRQNVDLIISRTPVRQLFAGYGPKFIKIFNELLETGDIEMIQKLQPEFDPFFCFLCEIPGIGETMARRMFYERSIRSMDDLRIAYTNNVLQRIPAFGDSRLHAIEIVLWNSNSNSGSWNSISSASFAEIQQNASEINSDNDNICSSMQLSLFNGKRPNESDVLDEHHSDDNVEYSDDHSSDLVCPDAVIPAKEDNSYMSVDKANCAYSKAFRDSNTELFRDVQFHNPADDIPDELLVEDDLNALLNEDQTVTPDPKLAAELGAFIKKDLREHGIDEEEENSPKATVCDIPAASGTSNDNEVHASIIHVRVLHAKHIEANVVQASIIRAETVHLNSRHTPILSSIVLQNDIINTSNVQADVIHADIIEVIELSAQYIDAHLMG